MSQIRDGADRFGDRVSEPTPCPQVVFAHAYVLQDLTASSVNDVSKVRDRPWNVSLDGRAGYREVSKVGDSSAPHSTKVVA